jgi:undecaprenyl-diphosphatase
MALPLADLSTSIHDLAGRSAALDDIMKFVAQDLLYTAALVFVVLWFRRDGLRAGLAAGLGALLAVGISTLIGDLHYSARPFIADHYTPLFVHPDDASFPSDHLCALGAVAGGAWMSSRLLGAATAALAALVAFARVYAGIHYLSDVVAGFLIGAVCAVLVWYAIRPALPLVDRLDLGLQRRGLRPRNPETLHRALRRRPP